MLKEIFTQSDEECLDSLMFDMRYKYALHTTSFKEQPISKNSLTNFRTAVYRYNEEHDVDLIQEEVESHAKAFTKLLNIDGRSIRMDSLMISSSCKKQSRLEIIYSCVSRLIKRIHKANSTMLLENLKPYLEEGHRNDTIYRCVNKDIQSKLDAVTADAITLYYLCRETEFEDSEDFKILSRMIGEQTQNVDGKVELKPAKEISPRSLQNPTDPDATYRKKGVKDYIGYVANVVESFDDQNRIILQYDLQQNTYSDQAFSNDTIDKLGKQEKTANVIVDGAYYSEELSRKAIENNIKLIPTSLVGRELNAEKTGFEKFNIDEVIHIVINCPLGHKPTDSRYKNGTYRARFHRELCYNCPNLSECPIRKKKKHYLFEISETSLHRSILKAKMGTTEYKEIANKRAGVEGIPSVLRRQYDVDNLPVRGKVRSKVWLGFKIAAINCKRFVKSRINAIKDPLTSKLINNLYEVFSYQGTVAAIFTA